MKANFEKNDLKLVAKRIHGFKSFVPMFHKHLEFIYILKGELKLCVDGFEKVLREKEISIAFPYVVHSYDSSPDLDAIIILFAPNLADSFHQELISKKPVYPYINDGSKLLPLLEGFLQYSANNDTMATAYLNVIIGEVIQALKLVKTKGMDLNATHQVLLYCSEHYKEKLSIKKVASALYLSESYLTKIFSNNLGCSFREHINTLRISKAKNLLKNTQMRIVDIMYECGFENQSSFNRIFIAQCNQTPREYRKNLMKEI